MENKKESELMCGKCGVPLEIIKTKFSYVGFDVHHEVPRCPVCGQVFISEDLVKGKMRDVESSLEDK